MPLEANPHAMVASRRCNFSEFLVLQFTICISMFKFKRNQRGLGMSYALVYLSPPAACPSSHELGSASFLFRCRPAEISPTSYSARALRLDDFLWRSVGFHRLGSGLVCFPKNGHLQSGQIFISFVKFWPKSLGWHLDRAGYCDGQVCHGNCVNSLHLFPFS